MSNDPRQSDAPQLKRVRKVLFCGHDSAGSRHMFDRICEAYPEIECRVIVATGIYYRKSTLASIWKLIRESSILFCAVRSIEMYWSKFRKRTLVQRLKNERVPHIFSDDINGDQAVSYAREFAPDLLISLYTMHIYKKPILIVPKLGAINSHPSILPNYRGLEVFFWAMANGETEIGSSVFFLNERVDDGLVIYERTLPIEPGDSMSGVYDRITESAADFLVKAIRDIDNDECKTRKPEGKGSYYPMPTRKSVRDFLRRGYKFF